MYLLFRILIQMFDPPSFIPQSAGVWCFVHAWCEQCQSVTLTQRSQSYSCNNAVYMLVAQTVLVAQVLTDSVSTDSQSNHVRIRGQSRDLYCSMTTKLQWWHGWFTVETLLKVIRTHLSWQNIIKYQKCFFFFCWNVLTWWSQIHSVLLFSTMPV